MISKELDEKNKVLWQDMQPYFNLKKVISDEITEASYYRLKNGKNIGEEKLNKVRKILMNIKWKIH